LSPVLPRRSLSLNLCARERPVPEMLTPLAAVVVELPAPPLPAAVAAGATLAALLLLWLLPPLLLLLPLLQQQLLPPLARRLKSLPERPPPSPLPLDGRLPLLVVLLSRQLKRPWPLQLLSRLSPSPRPRLPSVAPAP
jgi:hypothetical protein